MITFYMRLICLLAALSVASCGGGGGGSDAPPPPPPPPPTPVAIIDGPNAVPEKTQVTLTGSSNLSGNATFEWEIFTELEINPQVNGNTLSFEAPGVFATQFEQVTVALTVTQNGVSSVPTALDINIENQFTFEDKAEIVSAASFGSAESYLAIGQLARNAINQISAPNDNEEESEYCGFRGSRSITYSDTDSSDSSDSLSAGDSLRVEYSDCAIRALESNIFGAISFDIESISVDNTHVSGNINIDDLLVVDDFNQNVTSLGVINYSFSEIDGIRQIVMQSNNAVSFFANDEPLVEITQLNITKTEDLLAATTTLTMNGDLQDFVSEERYTLSTTTPISGFFNEYPEIGKLLFTGANNESFIASMIEIRNGNRISLQIDGQDYDYPWDAYIEDILVFVSTAQFPFLRDFISTNFELLGPVERFLVLTPSVQRVFQFMASRPVERLSSDTVEIRSSGGSEPPRAIDVISTGALVSFVIDDPVRLSAATTYDFSRFDVFDSFNQSLSLGPLFFTTSDALIPAILSTSLAYRENDFPALDATSSIINEGSQLSYQWSDESEFGITFTEPNQAMTEIILAQGMDALPDEINLGLLLSNELGQQAFKSITLRYVPLDASYILLDSEQGEFVGQGRQWVLYQNNGINIVEDNTDLGFLALRYSSDEVTFFLDIKAPSDSALAIGSYEGASRYPFQAEGQPGLSFSGDGRCCNESTGSFEILQLERNEAGLIEVLALDFTQFCESSNGSALRGKVRINANTALNL
jgi:hypothetical protein